MLVIIVRVELTAPQKVFSIALIAKQVFFGKRHMPQSNNSRGGVEDTRHEAKAKVTKKNRRPRPRTAFPRTDTLEAKDRNARGQGQGPRTQAQVLSKKKKKRGLHKNFSGDLQKKKGLHKNFSGNLQKKNVFQKIFQALHKILTIQKIVLSSSRGQANFRGLEASRPRTSKCVLEDVLEAKNILEDSTSA